MTEKHVTAVSARKLVAGEKRGKKCNLQKALKQGVTRITTESYILTDWRSNSTFVLNGYSKLH